MGIILRKGKLILSFQIKIKTAQVPLNVSEAIFTSSYVSHVFVTLCVYDVCVCGGVRAYMVSTHIPCAR